MLAVRQGRSLFLYNLLLRNLAFLRCVFDWVIFGTQRTISSQSWDCRSQCASCEEPFLLFKAFPIRSGQTLTLHQTFIKKLVKELV